MVVLFPLILSDGSSLKCMCWLGLSWILSGNPLHFSRVPTLSSSFLSATKSCSSSQIGLPSSQFCLNSGMTPGSTWDPCTLAWNLSGGKAMRAPLSGFPTSQRQIIGPSSSGAQCLENHSCLKAVQKQMMGQIWSRDCNLLTEIPKRPCISQTHMICSKKFWPFKITPWKPIWTLYRSFPKP